MSFVPRVRPFQDGVEACRAGTRAKVPIYLVAHKILWLSGYYEEQGYARARDGVISPADSDNRSFCSQCRNRGMERYFRERAEIGSRSHIDSSREGILHEGRDVAVAD